MGGVKCASIEHLIFGHSKKLQKFVYRWGIEYEKKSPIILAFSFQYFFRLENFALKFFTILSSILILSKKSFLSLFRSYVSSFYILNKTNSDQCNF